MTRVMNRATSSAHRIFEVLDTEPEVVDQAAPVRIEPLAGRVTFEGVSLRVRGEPAGAAPGELRRVAGRDDRPGGPLGRRQDHHRQPDRPLLRPARGGTVRIDGIDLRTVDTGSYRRQVGMVLQDPYLFHGTIADNIRYGLPDAPIDQVVAAARAANAHDFVCRLPHGYDTIVGERGPHPLGRRAPAHLHRPGPAARPAHPDPRRGHQLGRHRDRAQDRGGHAPPDRRAHRLRHRPPPVHPAPGHPPVRDRGRAGWPSRAPTPSSCPTRPAPTGAWSSCNGKCNTPSDAAPARGREGTARCNRWKRRPPPPQASPAEPVRLQRRGDGRLCADRAGQLTPGAPGALLPLVAAGRLRLAARRRGRGGRLRGRPRRPRPRLAGGPPGGARPGRLRAAHPPHPVRARGAGDPHLEGRDPRRPPHLPDRARRMAPPPRRRQPAPAATSPATSTSSPAPPPWTPPAAASCGPSPTDMTPSDRLQRGEPPRAAEARARAGVLYAGGAFFIWGMVPLYFSALHGVSALEIIAHRVLWSAVFLAGLLAVTRGFGELRVASRAGRGCWRCWPLTSALVAINWLTFVWAVNAGRLLDTSLGYFITPQVNVLLGFLFLRERLRPAPVGGAAAGGGRGDEPDLAAGAAPLDRPRAGAELRVLRPVPQADPGRPGHRPAGRDPAGHPPGPRLSGPPLARRRPPVRPRQPAPGRHAGLPRAWSPPSR